MGCAKIHLVIDSKNQNDHKTKSQDLYIYIYKESKLTYTSDILFVIGMALIDAIEWVLVIQRNGNRLKVNLEVHSDKKLLYHFGWSHGPSQVDEHLGKAQIVHVAVPGVPKQGGRQDSKQTIVREEK
jgi:hypothetical protein